ncbi:methylated-DNA--[protein]-cysteine S-methyltransferase [Bacteroides sp. 51]|uniref:methylated-DNA--[protein]-cysteine S-methyltransferase n=1 Tax=Bacteroides sp. 51 TaxID=2302938 RepID=UPI0013D24C66|nr:MGMT family protein [Bacteroides sp. 51]NDV84029.1 MGMT family protein [Bacteroides sp. 51]
MKHSRLNKKNVLDHMIEELPAIPWADIEILDWLSGDDTLPIEYYFSVTSFGQVLAANTSKGICYLGLVQGKPEDVFSDFNKRFRHAVRIEKQTPLQQQVLHFLNGERNEYITFHLRGTPYQTEIWRRLIRIPYGKVISYATLGGSAQYSRAAGTANGRNPIFWIIPCHRAVKTDGSFDRYFWGEDVKKKLLAWEFANYIPENTSTLPDNNESYI